MSESTKATIEILEHYHHNGGFYEIPVEVINTVEQENVKVIELLNKIANEEELPNKIRFNNIEWNKVYGDKNVCYLDEYDSDFFLYFFRNNLDFALNDEVEIIEEDKKIEYIECCIKNGKHYIEDSCFRVQPLENNEIVIIDKINEIIKKINKLETK